MIPPRGGRRHVLHLLASLLQAPPAARQETDLGEMLQTASAKVVRDDDKLDEAIRRIARQVAMEEVGKRPEVTVVVSRLLTE